MLSKERQPHRLKENEMKKVFKILGKILLVLVIVLVVSLLMIYEDLAEYHVHRIPRMGVDECVTDYPDLLCIVSHSQGCSLPLW